MLAHGPWFSPGTPASSTTKTGRNDIAEILLKVALNTNKLINQVHVHIKILHNYKNEVTYDVYKMYNSEFYEVFALVSVKIRLYQGLFWEICYNEL